MLWRVRSPSLRLASHSHAPLVYTLRFRLSFSPTLVLAAFIWIIHVVAADYLHRCPEGLGECCRLLPPGWRWFGGADQTSGGVPLLTTISCLAGVRFFSLQLFTVLNPASSRPHTFPRLRAGNEEWAGCRGEGG